MNEQKLSPESVWEAVKKLKLPEQIAVADALVPRILAVLRAKKENVKHRTPRWELRRWLKQLEEAEEFWLKAEMRLWAVNRGIDTRW